MKPIMWNVSCELDDLIMLIKEYALADNATLTKDARELKQALLAAIQPALEAQHRKTWAMAIERAAGYANYLYKRKHDDMEAAANLYDELKALNCPPINESKEG